MKTNVHYAAYCKKCGTIIFSRATHDYRSCKCGKIAIDGGFDYNKVSFDKEKDIVFFAFNLPKALTKRVLYKDWNENKDEHGYYLLGECPIFLQKGFQKKIDETMKGKDNEN